MTNAFDFAPLLPAGRPPPAAKWTGRPNTISSAAITIPTNSRSRPDRRREVVLRREGRTLATYGLPAVRRAIALARISRPEAQRDAGIDCTTDES